jgi:hypothetical protein
MFRSKVDLIANPSNAIWGPALWMILHSACEQIGSQTLKKLPQEESRIWIGLLQSLRYSLPCPQCKKHYTAYFNQTPIRSIQKDNIRTWLFNLHNNVNQRIGKKIFEDLSQYKSSFYFTEYYKLIQAHMLMAVRQGTCSHPDVQRTIRFLLEMKCFYDFF